MGPPRKSVCSSSDLEAGIADEPVDRTVEVAPTGDTLLDAIAPVLPPRDAGIGAQAVLEEVELPTGPQDPSHFSEGPGRVGDGAEGESGEGGVDGLVGERDVLTVETDELHWHGGRCDALRRQRTSDRRRIDGEDLLDLVGVHRHVEARAEPDLEHDAAETRDGASPVAANLFVAQHDVGQPGYHLLAPCAHAGSVRTPTAQAAGNA